MIEFIKDKTCYFLVKRLLMNNKAVTFSGPYGWAEQKTTEQIKEFLIRENGKKAPHLNSQNTVSTPDSRPSGSSNRINFIRLSKAHHALHFQTDPSLDWHPPPRKLQ